MAVWPGQVPSGWNPIIYNLINTHYAAQQFHRIINPGHLVCYFICYQYTWATDAYHHRELSAEFDTGCFPAIFFFPGLWGHVYPGRDDGRKTG